MQKSWPTVVVTFLRHIPIPTCSLPKSSNGFNGSMHTGITHGLGGVDNPWEPSHKTHLIYTTVEGKPRFAARASDDQRITDMVPGIDLHVYGQGEDNTESIKYS